MTVNQNKQNSEDTEALGIYQDALFAVQEIIARRRELDLAGHYDQILYVPVGEIHDMSAHLIHNAVLLHLLTQYEDRIAVGVEAPHNFLSTMSDMPVAEGVPSAEYGIESLNNALRLLSGYEADLANKLLYKTILTHAKKNHVSVIFNDVASSDYGLDFSDFSTRETALQIMGENIVGQDVSLGCKVGFMLRNIFMANNLEAFAQKQKARIALQFCGQGHIAGNQKWSFVTSLSSCFEQMNVPFQAVFLNADEMHYCAERLDDNHKVLSTNVPTYVTHYNPVLGRLDYNNRKDRHHMRHYRPDFKSREEEEEFINEKLENMGLPELQIHMKLA